MRTFPSSNAATQNVAAASNAAYSANATAPPTANIAPPPTNAPAAPPQIPAQQLAALLGLATPSAQPMPVGYTNGAAPTLQTQMQALSLPQPVVAPQPAAPLPPANPPAAPAVSADLNQQFQVIAQLVQSGLSPDQIAQVMSAMGIPMPPVPAAPAPVAAPVPVPSYVPVSGAPQPATQGTTGQYDSRRRTRSRSPDRDFKRRRVTPPNRRESPVYGIYDPDAQTEPGRPPDMDRHGRNNHGKGWNRNRRSPPGRPAERVASPMLRGGAAAPGSAPGPNNKYIAYDNSLPSGHIRVLSRTLFVGGVAATEPEIRQIFSRFGQVQTCIVNIDKRHAFVKMVNRPDAVNAKTGMDLIRDPDVQSKIRSTKWGVGFGPRDCSDYSSGVSVVPISKLTEADKRWLLTAEYGGTGGKPIEGGMEVEEPDIEIGAGVSSKGT